MFLFGSKYVFTFALFCINKESMGLIMLPKVEINITVEPAIRTTYNNLFYSLGLKLHNPRIKRLAVTYKSFTLLAQQNFDSLNEIAKLAKVDNNKTKDLNSDLIGYIVETIFLSSSSSDKINVKSNHKNDNNTTVKSEGKTLVNVNNVLNVSSLVYKEVMKVLQNEENSALFYGFDKDIDGEDSEDIPEMHFKTRRIYKGYRTKIKNYPFMASIQVFNKFQCGGSIIKSDLVITAASCLQLAWNNRLYRENPAFLSVRVGSTFYGFGGEVIEVLEVYFHPSYTPKFLLNNIAIVRLVRKIKWKRKMIRKIKLDKEQHSLPINIRDIIIVGWGARTQSNMLQEPWQNRLQEAILHVVKHRECKEYYSKEYVNEKNFCAGHRTGACNRDAGDPGIDSDTLVGIVSFGAPVCGTRGAPTVFTKVGFYTDWIEEIMEQEVPIREHRTTLKPRTYSYGREIDLPAIQQVIQPLDI